MKHVDRLDQTRILLRTEMVKLHVVPPWLRKKLRTYGASQKWERGRPAEMLLADTANRFRGGGYGWLDHWGSSAGGPFLCCQEHGPVFVTEPYGGCDAAMAGSLTTFCEALGGLVWHATSNTWWNPGHTIRISIHLPQRKDGS